MYFVKGRPRGSKERRLLGWCMIFVRAQGFSDTMAFLAHCNNHSTNIEISFRDEGVHSFTKIK